MLLPYSNITIRHWNPGATMPLILPVQVVRNVGDDIIRENVRRNSRLDREWVQQAEPHDGIAVLCGSGPSLADTVEEIRERAAGGQTVFALNGAAKYLHDHGIMPDLQIILDARRETADLIGPARVHLFASQVHPECFARVPAAKLWHLMVDDFDDLIPETDRSYCIVGGAASVGVTATCLAFALGYRELHLYGYDSCHRDGRGHAFRQGMNDGEPTAEVRFGGRVYTASLTMKLQAEQFMLTARALRDAGVRIEVHGSGLLPDMWRAPREALEEAEKYERLWQTEVYRAFSPGEHMVGVFLSVVRPDGMVIDLGCGTGRAGLKIAEAGLPVTLLDFAENARDEAARHLPFVRADLRQPLPVSAPYGFCADVMEHIPPEDVDAVLRNILAACPSVFFQISTAPDQLGTLIGHTLHLTVQPHEWWREKFRGPGVTIRWEGRTATESLFHVVTDMEKACD